MYYRLYFIFCIKFTNFNKLFSIRIVIMVDINLVKQHINHVLNKIYAFKDDF